MADNVSGVDEVLKGRLLALLKEGRVEEFNTSRPTQRFCVQGEVRNFFVELDFSGEDFSGLDLQGVNLAVTVLRGTNFTGADLRRADLSLANVEDADFSGTKLFDACTRRIQGLNAREREQLREARLGRPVEHW